MDGIAYINHYLMDMRKNIFMEEMEELEEIINTEEDSSIIEDIKNIINYAKKNDIKLKKFYIDNKRFEKDFCMDEFEVMKEGIKTNDNEVLLMYSDDRDVLLDIRGDIISNEEFINIELTMEVIDMLSNSKMSNI